MKKTVIALSLLAAIGVTGWSTTKDAGVKAPVESTTAIKDTRITTEFTDEGVKLHYTFTGKLEKIEVFGVAPAWKGNYAILAEADAMDKLVKFVHGKDVSSQRRVKVISRSIERAADNTLNKFQSTDSTVTFKASDLESDEPTAGNDGELTTKTNTAKRNASVVDQTLINTVTNITARGRITGVRKTRDMKMDEGKTYVAVYEWSENQQATAEFIRDRMMKRAK
jgi:hypothetical protein